MLVLGLDIGGANLKAATTAGQALTEPFEIWRAPAELASRLRRLIAVFPGADQIAVTMTAELADCFATKQAGVAAIVAAVREAVGATPARVWQSTGRFADLQAAAQSRAVAAANWHALATWGGRFAPGGRGLLIDIGSTTTDIIPLADGRPAARGATDLERLLNHELVYAGARRTPLCAVAAAVTVRGRTCPVAAELFATMLDVGLLLGRVAEDAADLQTADGRPATIARAHDRIARMVCCDRDEIGLAEARQIARCFDDALRNRLLTAIGVVAGRDDGGIRTVIVSGSGDALALRLIAEHPATQQARVVRLADRLSAALADAACAYAVACLAETADWTGGSTGGSTGG